MVPLSDGCLGRFRPSFTVTYGRQRDFVNLPTRGTLSSGDDLFPLDLHPLDSRDTRQIESVGHPDADLVVSRIGRLVAEQEQVKPVCPALLSSEWLRR